jgi:hypothetical protein
LDLQGNVHPYYIQTFQAIFGPCLQIMTHFPIFSVAYLTTVLVSEIRPLQCRVLQ